MVGTNQKSKTAIGLREEARRLIEAAKKEQDAAARVVLLEEALKLAVAAEKLDRLCARTKPAA